MSLFFFINSKLRNIFFLYNHYSSLVQFLKNIISLSQTNKWFAALILDYLILHLLVTTNWYFMKIRLKISRIYYFYEDSSVSFRDRRLM